MEGSKLMIPLFYNGNFNCEGRKMRSVLEREISDGAQTYRLWRAVGKPDLDYPRAENDKYILHVEINGYLISLGMTDFSLTDYCGFESAAEKLYGGKDQREKWFDALKESRGSDAVSAALTKEKSEIERLGGDPARQTEYIRTLLNKRVDTYQKAKANGGQTSPDFAGALVMDDLAQCIELSEVYRTKQKADEAARRVRAAAEEKAYCEERNRVADQAISTAMRIIREGGVLKNETITFYQGRYSSSTYSIINYMMRQYRVDVPLRTQGWINEMLSSATIQDGKCEHYQFFRSKRGKGSQKFFECMNNLIQAVIEQALDEAKDGAA